MIRLPSHVESKISDPLSILDSSEALVPYWDFLTALLKPLLYEKGEKDIVSRFIDVFETISYSLNGHGSPDSSLLLEFAKGDQLSRLVDPIIRSALSMKEMFPEGIIYELQVPLETKSSATSLSLTCPQISCLITHMLLGTFSKPPWMTWEGPNLSTLFADDGKGDRKIKSAYIRVLLAYLEANLVSNPHPGPDKESVKVPVVTFSLFDSKHSYSIGNSSSGKPSLSLSNLLSVRKALIPLKIFTLEEEDDDNEACFINTSEKTSIQREEFCQLVSANNEIGFGPSATQEERVFGSCPSLLPSVLFTPPLSPTASLLVSGGTGVYGHFTGHLRSAQLRQLYSTSERRCQNRTGRSFVFLDALEMDGDRHGKDVEAENVLREMHKLMSGFSALALRSKERGDRSVVIVPPWGCGTFGGDFKVKLLLIWAAATICEIDELRCPVKEAWWLALNADWRNLIDVMRGKEDKGGAWDVSRLWKLISSLESGARIHGVIDWLDCWNYVGHSS